MANQCTKFEVFSLCFSRIFRGDKKGHVTYHVPFRDSLSSVGWDLLWSTCKPNFKPLCSPTMKILQATQNVKIGVV